MSPFLSSTPPVPSRRPCVSPIILAALVAWAGAVLADTAKATDAEGSPPVEMAAGPIIATYRGGVVTRDELQALIADRPLSRRGDARVQTIRRLRELVLERELAQRFLAAGGPALPEADSWKRLLERKQAQRAFERWLVRSAEPDSAEVAARAAELPLGEAPARWRLSNLFLRAPPGASPSEREALRTEAQALRRRLTEGADFAELARLRSDSQTGLRGGRMGSVPLARLRPELARAVATLEPGALSEVIETEDGWTIFLCEAVYPARTESRDEVERRVRQRLLGAELERLRGEQFARVRNARAPELVPAATLERLRRDARPEEATVVRFSDGVELSLRDLTFFLRDQKRTWPRDVEGFQAAVRDLADQHLAAEAARDRGLLDLPQHRQALAREVTALWAELELRRLAAPMVSPASAADLEALYRSQPDAFTLPETVRLRSVELPLRPVLSREVVHAFEDGARRVAAGELALEDLAKIAPGASRIDHGWLRPAQVFQLGRAVDLAVSGAPDGVGRYPFPAAAGSVLGPLQEGRKLMVVAVDGRRPKRLQSLSEAEPALRALWLRRQWAVAERSVRDRLLEEIDFEIRADELLSGPSANGSSDETVSHEKKDGSGEQAEEKPPASSESPPSGGSR